jgi:hypothetical protein
MGYGTDEAWEPEVEREVTEAEQAAISFFQYDEDEFFDMSHGEREEKIWMARRLATGRARK